MTDQSSAGLPSFDDKHYVPFLKGKAGEFKALGQIGSGDKSRLTPLLEIAPRVIDWKTDQPKETTTEALEGDAEQIATAWGTDAELFVDLGAFDPADRLDSGDHPVDGFFSDARAAGLAAIPVTGLDRDHAFNSAVAVSARTDQLGAAVRLTRDFADDLGQLAKDLETLLTELEIEPGMLDLLLDLGEVASASAAPIQAAAEKLLRGLPNPHEWRTLTLASGAFPVSPATSVGPGSAGLIPRRDWKLWQDLRNVTPELPRLPAYGDYAVAHPEFLAFNPSKMTITAGIRYTCPDDWLVVRGRAIKGAGSGLQFHNLAKQTTVAAQYRGPSHCQGCKHIDDCANHRLGPGNLTTWRTVGTHHHLKQVAEQIASLP